MQSTGWNCTYLRIESIHFFLFVFVSFRFDSNISKHLKWWFRNSVQRYQHESSKVNNREKKIRNRRNMSISKWISRNHLKIDFGTKDFEIFDGKKSMGSKNVHKNNEKEAVVAAEKIKKIALYSRSNFDSMERKKKKKVSEQKMTGESWKEFQRMTEWIYYFQWFHLFIYLKTDKYKLRE